ncbi:hypothetical protein AB0J55_04975 [Amycolatopsis sp. NPDC049688]|uniref:hypothetical protein n=1 Tax=Amycolatopsis sp. NPDC049688 TaxID=3154733 RepID=UPI0034332804
MGRHYRDEEPVPHPQDRTPRVPAEGRSEASGAFRTPGRSSISDAFGIAGRAAGAARESSGSAFFTEGAEAPGFPPAPGGPQPVARRGETSGAYPVTGTRRGEASGAYPAAGGGESTVTRAPRRGEASGAYPAANRIDVPGTTATHPARPGETSGAYGIDASGGSHPARRGEASGSYPAAAPGASTATHPARRGEGTGSHPAATPVGSTATHPARRGEGTGSHPAAAPAGSTATHPARRGEASGAHPAPAPARRGEASGAYPAAEPTGRRASRRREAPAENSAEVTTAYPAVAESGTRSRRGKRAAARQPESAAERTEVITRQDDSPGDLAARGDDTAERSENTVALRTPEPGDTTGPQRAGHSDSTVALRTPDRGDTTGPQRTGRTDSTGPSRAGRSEGTGSHRVVGKGDVTGSHRIVGKKAPRRRIATWPIACLVLAALIGLGIVGWNWADNELNSRAEAQAASCDGGTAQMRIVVTPSVQKPLTAAAQRWNQAATVVHGQCVHVTIDAKPSAQVLDALVGRAKLDSIGGLPAAWLPESSYWVSELTTKKPEMIGSPAQSVANARSADYPFVGLAGPGIDDTALRAAQTFREYLEQPAQQADFAAAGIKSA